MLETWDPTIYRERARHGGTRLPACLKTVRRSLFVMIAEDYEKLAALIEERKGLQG
jgi:hypothetical protein